MIDVSVIVPCFNQGKYLDDSIYSLSCQSDLRIEVIIVNDGSSDIAYKSFAGQQKLKYPCLSIKLIEQDNQGLSIARNTGMNAAAGRYLSFLDADDMMARDILTRHVQNIKISNKDISICNYLLCNDDRSRFWSPSINTISQYRFSFDNIALFWERGYTIPIHCAMFDRSVVSDVRFLPSLSAKEDWLFWLGVSHGSAEATYLNVDGAIYRQHASAMTKDLRKMGIQWLRAIKEAQTLFPHRFSRDMASSGISHFREFYLRHFWAESGCDFPSRFYDELFNS